MDYHRIYDITDQVSECADLVVRVVACSHLNHRPHWCLYDVALQVLL